MGKDELKQILTSVKNNYIKQYQYLLSIDGIELNFEDGALNQIVDNCLKLKTGARGLHTEIERVLMPHMFNVNKYKENNVKVINISQDAVIEPKIML